MSTQFLTKSLVKAAFLEASFGIRCELQKDRDGKAVFFFPLQQRVVKASESFELNASIPARSFAQAVGTLRTRCRELRHSS